MKSGNYAIEIKFGVIYYNTRANIYNVKNFLSNNIIQRIPLMMHSITSLLCREGDINSFQIVLQWHIKQSLLRNICKYTHIRFNLSFKCFPRCTDLIYVMNNVLIMCKIMVPYCGFYIPWIHRNCVIIYYCHDFIFACSHNMNSFLLFKFQVSYFYEVMVWTFSSIFKDEIQEFRPFLAYKNFDGMLVAATYELLMVSWLHIGSGTLVYFIGEVIPFIQNIWNLVSLVFAVKPGLSSEGLATASSWVVNTHNRLNCYTMYHICN